MIDGIPLDIGLSDITAAGLLGLVVILIIVGKLVPVSVLRDVQRQRDYWRDIAVKLQRANTTLADAAKESIEPAKTVAKVVTAAQERLGVVVDVQEHDGPAVD